MSSKILCCYFDPCDSCHKLCYTSNTYAQLQRSSSLELYITLGDSLNKHYQVVYTHQNLLQDKLKSACMNVQYMPHVSEIEPVSAIIRGSFIHSFIHSFIYFGLCKSVQGLNNLKDIELVIFLIIYL